MAEKNDLNRIGLFSELGYISIGDPYVPPNSSEFFVCFALLFETI